MEALSIYYVPLWPGVCGSVSWQFVPCHFARGCDINFAFADPIFGGGIGCCTSTRTPEPAPPKSVVKTLQLAFIYMAKGEWGIVLGIVTNQKQQAPHKNKKQNKKMKTKIDHK